MYGIFNQVHSAYKSGSDPANKAAHVIDTLSGNEEKSKQVRGKIEDYLQHSDQAALKPDNTRSDVNKILPDPSTARAVIGYRME